MRTHHWGNWSMPQEPIHHRTAEILSHILSEAKVQLKTKFSTKYILWRSNKQTKDVLKWLWMLKNGNDWRHYRQLAEAGAWFTPRLGQIRWCFLWGAVLLCTLLLSFKQPSVSDFPWRVLLRVQKGMQASCGPLPQIQLFV